MIAWWFGGMCRRSLQTAAREAAAVATSGVISSILTAVILITRWGSHCLWLLWLIVDEIRSKCLLFCEMMKVDCQPCAVVALTNRHSHSCFSGLLTSQMFAIILLPPSHQDQMWCYKTGHWTMTAALFVLQTTGYFLLCTGTVQSLSDLCWFFTVETCFLCCPEQLWKLLLAISLYSCQFITRWNWNCSKAYWAKNNALAKQLCVSDYSKQHVYILAIVLDLMVGLWYMWLHVGFLCQVSLLVPSLARRVRRFVTSHLTPMSHGMALCTLWCLKFSSFLRCAYVVLGQPQLLLSSDCMLSNIFISLISVKSSITNKTEWPVTLVMWNHMWTFCDWYLG